MTYQNYAESPPTSEAKMNCSRAAEITLRAAVATFGGSDAAAREMIRACAAAYPHEACGFLLSDGTAVAVENHADIPHSAYVIAPEDLARYGERVIGVFHSHPDGEAAFSARDRALMQAGWRYIVIATHGTMVTDVAII